MCAKALPIEDYFGLFGFVDGENYAGNEDSEDIDSEDLAIERSSADSEDSEEFVSDSEGPKDMIFNNNSGRRCNVYDRRSGIRFNRDLDNYSGECYYIRGRYGIKRQNLSNCCNSEFDKCKDDEHRGCKVPNCSMTLQQCLKQGRPVDVL